VAHKAAPEIISSVGNGRPDTGTGSPRLLQSPPSRSYRRQPSPAAERKDINVGQSLAGRRHGRDPNDSVSFGFVGSRPVFVSRHRVSDDCWCVAHRQTARLPSPPRRGRWRVGGRRAGVEWAGVAAASGAAVSTSPHSCTGRVGCFQRVPLTRRQRPVIVVPARGCVVGRRGLGAGGVGGHATAPVRRQAPAQWLAAWYWDAVAGGAGGRPADATPLVPRTCFLRIRASAAAAASVEWRSHASMRGLWHWGLSFCGAGGEGDRHDAALLVLPTP